MGCHRQEGSRSKEEEVRSRQRGHAQLVYTTGLFHRCRPPSGVPPRTRNAWQAALPQSGIGLTLWSWRGSGYRPNLPLFGLSTSASAEHGAALWAWRSKTVLGSALATNFSNSIFPDDSFSLSQSFLLIVFFFFSFLRCQHLLQHARTSFLSHMHTRARARARTHTHSEFRIFKLFYSPQCRTFVLLNKTFSRTRIVNI